MGKKRGFKGIKRVKRNNSKIKNAKSVELSNGLKFRSKLELFTYNKLIDNDIKDFDYEKEKFTLMEGFTFENESVEAFDVKDGDRYISKFEGITNNIRSITYLPDFTCVDHETKKGWIIECKGYSNDAFPLKWKMFKNWLTINGYKVDLYKPNNQKNVLKCINLIKEKYYERTV